MIEIRHHENGLKTFDRLSKEPNLTLVFKTMALTVHVFANTEIQTLLVNAMPYKTESVALSF